MPLLAYMEKQSRDIYIKDSKAKFEDLDTESTDWAVMIQWFTPFTN